MIKLSIDMGRLPRKTKWKKQTVCIYHHSLGKSEGKNEAFHLYLFVYALKMYKSGNIRNQELEVICGKAGGRMCSMESGPKTERRHSAV